MKILLDECVTRKLIQHLTEFEVKTVVEMNWSGLKNGHLLSAAIEEKFDILLTIDKNITFQQNMSNYEIAVVVLDVKKSKLEIRKIAEFGKGKVHLIEKIKLDSDLEH
jgi:MinD superfamily P-loop ATPase